MTGPPSLASRCCGDRSATATIVQRTVGLPEGKRRAPRDIEIFHMMYATIGVHNAAAGTPRHPGRTDMMTRDRHALVRASSSSRSSSYSIVPQPQLF